MRRHGTPSARSARVGESMSSVTAPHHRRTTSNTMRTIRMMRTTVPMPMYTDPAVTHFPSAPTRGSAARGGHRFVGDRVGRVGAALAERLFGTDGRVAPRLAFEL